MTATEGRRHRPSTKKSEVETPTEERARRAGARAASRTGAGSKRGALAGKRGSLREDKREHPDEMVSSARPKNLKAEKDDRLSKGKSTHALEASGPGKQPPRKSTRRGANGVKPDSQLRRRATRAVRSPKQRQAMRGG